MPSWFPCEEASRFQPSTVYSILVAYEGNRSGADVKELLLCGCLIDWDVSCMRAHMHCNPIDTLPREQCHSGVRLISLPDLNRPAISSGHFQHPLMWYSNGSHCTAGLLSTGTTALGLTEWGLSVLSSLKGRKQRWDWEQFRLPMAREEPRQL